MYTSDIAKLAGHFNLAKQIVTFDNLGMYQYFHRNVRNYISMNISNQTYG